MFENRPRDGRNLTRRLALAEDDLGKTAAPPPVGIDAREAKVDEIAGIEDEGRGSIMVGRAASGWDGGRGAILAKGGHVPRPGSGYGRRQLGTQRRDRRRRRQEPAHRDHVALKEAVAAEELLGRLVQPVGQQRDALEVLLAGKIQRIN